MDPLTTEQTVALSKEINTDLRDIAQWLVKLAESGGNIQTFLGRITVPVPANSNVRFWMADVDDEATLRCEGLFAKFNRGQPPQEYFQRVGVRGRNIVILTLINSGGLHYGIQLHMDVPGAGRLINLTDNGTDIPPYGLQRNYIYTFDVV